MDTAFLIVPLLRAFSWLEEGLQTYLRDRGWEDVTRPQAMALVAVVMGVTRPSEIARLLGVSRQAVHTTIAGMVDLDLFELMPDPDDRRSKTVLISERGQPYGEHALAASRAMAAELTQRIGAENLEALRKALNADWGRPMRQFASEA